MFGAVHCVQANGYEVLLLAAHFACQSCNGTLSSQYAHVKNKLRHVNMTGQRRKVMCTGKGQHKILARVQLVIVVVVVVVMAILATADRTLLHFDSSK